MVRICLFIILLFNACSNNKILKEIKKLPDYPSASGIEYFNYQFYIIGDDATHLLITDSKFNSVDSISLYTFAGKRIPKTIKADLEAITVLNDSNQQKILLLGSGSLSPYRNTGWLIDPNTKHKDSIRLDIFYQRLNEGGFTDINIEGICSIPGTVILANRGNKTYPKNFLIFTKEGFWRDQLETSITMSSIGINDNSTVFNGVSGMSYSPETDQLIITVSTEDTPNSFDDGTIGKSYLWIVNDISTKRNQEAIIPDKIIDLEKMDNRFKGYKIESVCITAITEEKLHLVLAADNDNGSSTLFRLQIPKN